MFNLSVKETIHAIDNGSLSYSKESFENLVDYIDDLELMVKDAAKLLEDFNDDSRLLNTHLELHFENKDELDVEKTEEMLAELTACREAYEHIYLDLEE